jgi:hypothetical protein
MKPGLVSFLPENRSLGTSETKSDWKNMPKGGKSGLVLSL